MPLSQPQTDGAGEVVPHDHAEILGTDRLIRRVSEQQVVADKGIRRLSSLAFKPSSGANGGISVDLETQIIEAGLDPVAYVTTPRWTGSVVLSVANVRQAGMLVGYEPLDTNPYHGEIWGPFPRANVLAAMAQWYVPIDGVAILA